MAGLIVLKIKWSNDMTLQNSIYINRRKKEFFRFIPKMFQKNLVLSFPTTEIINFLAVKLELCSYI